MGKREDADGDSYVMHGIECFETSSVIEDLNPKSHSRTFSVIENIDRDQSGPLCDDHVFADSVQGIHVIESSALLGANSLHLEKGISINEINDYPELETLTDSGILNAHESQGASITTQFLNNDHTMKMNNFAGSKSMLKLKSKFDKPVAHEPIYTSQFNV